MGKRRTYTTDDTTFASNPGNVILKPLIYMRFFPKWGLILASLFLLSLALQYSWFSFFLSAFAVLLNWVYWTNRKEHFRVGDSNPGIVIQTNPTLVAVVTDLRKADGEYPVVKIIKVPIRKFQKGDIVGTVALYGNSSDSIPHWADFYPIAINCATNNSVEIENAIRSYTQAQFSDLDHAVSQLTEPYMEGLYKVHNEHSSW